MVPVGKGNKIKANTILTSSGNICISLLDLEPTSEVLSVQTQFEEAKTQAEREKML